jgi:hypothetical protein
MALPSRPAGSIRTPIEITWTDLDLTGATITGTLRPIGGVERAIAGSIGAISSSAFQWEPDATDVVEGVYLVQFMASFATGRTPEKTTLEHWTVTESLS